MQKKTTNEFILDAIVVHKNKYDYSLVDYKNNRTKIHIMCKEHGIFKQTPSDHLTGYGCTLCAGERTKYEKYKGKPTILYYIRISEVYWKIGLTQATIEKRFNKELGSNIKIETIFTKVYEDGWEAFLIEQKILKDTNHLMIKKKDSPIKGGWTEVRITDIYDYISLEVH